MQFMHTGKCPCYMCEKRTRQRREKQLKVALPVSLGFTLVFLISTFFA